ncbi:MAG: hypothetical protein K2H35_08240 [Muribaculaceae bacterium]|nr:hypothetical protein [Muribaculaceae bacterium]
MSRISIPLNLDSFDKKSEEYKILSNAEKNRATIAALIEEERYLDAMERTVSTLRELRDFPDIEQPEFRAILASILFDMAEIHFFLKDYQRSEKELDTLFKILNRLAREDADRFGEFHILAMELAARILRSRKKTLDTLAKQKENVEALYDKVNSGVANATERLAEALRKVGELLASAGQYREALKFYSEAIKFSKKRSGRIGRKEIKMTIEMAEVMSRIKQMRERAKRLLSAVLPHAIALEILELEEDIIALLETIETLDAQPSRWKAFTQAMSRSISKATQMARKAASRISTEAESYIESASEFFSELSDNSPEISAEDEADILIAADTILGDDDAHVDESEEKNVNVKSVKDSEEGLNGISDKTLEKEPERDSTEKSEEEK